MICTQIMWICSTRPRYRNPNFASSFFG
uniref:Uncharacterized protein n=1 Tax=Arundo donax TaxID=35708 RepID=A0A0A9A2Q8_ARUDO